MMDGDSDKTQYVAFENDVFMCSHMKKGIVDIHVLVAYRKKNTYI